MKKSSQFLFETLNLLEEKEKVWKATITMKDSEGNPHKIEVQSEINIRSEVHKTVESLKKKGMKLDSVLYEE